jgi:Na+/H+-dicarboxylate symporter
MLQVLLVSILTGFAIARMGELGERINAASRRWRRSSA